MSSAARHRIVVARAEHKFSCAHMTVFPDGTAERLHGHNYTVGVALEVSDIRFEALIDFGAIKRAVRALCAELRERTILAERNPRLEVVRRDGGEVELRLCGKRYVLPEEDVLFLPIENATTEELSHFCATRLEAQLRPTLDRSAAIGLEVRVEESPGQGATTTLPIATGV
ncbi:MAG TPA: 6-carboxytetrahydropterin synthase [Kofleriaceae bacterium]|nr:6-carboxytetrahydropterin synthase [Kofleriaceae bacterium]